MQCPRVQAAASRPASRRRQSGVVMVITLLALLVLLVASVALVRSFDTSMVLAGNLAVKRDLLNQGELGVEQAVALLSTGGELAAEASRWTDHPDQNYFATTLPSNGQGIPNALISEEEFARLGQKPLHDIKADNGVQIRVVVDRQCSASGEFTMDNCMSPIASSDPGGSDFLKKPSGESRAAYRISVRVKDTHRNTETYLQTIATI